MSNAVIGALRVVLGADTVAFDKGLKGTERPLKNLKSQFKKVAAAGAAMGAALSLAIRSGLQDIDRVAKAARTIDGTSAALRALELAAGDAGVSQSDVTNAAQRMTREIARAAREGGRGADALKRLGLEASRLSEMDADERMATIADRVRELGLSSGQTMDLLRDLGVRSEEMALLMTQGGGAIRAARREVQALGLDLDENAIRQVERTNDALSRIGLAFQAFKNRLAAQVAPALENLANAFVAAMREGTAFRRVMDAITENLHIIMGAVGGVVAALGVRLVGALVAVRAAAIAATISLKGFRTALMTTGFGVAVAGLGALAGALFASELGFDNNTRAIGDERQALLANIGALRSNQEMSKNVALQKLQEIRARRENIQAINDENKALLRQAEIEVANARRAMALAEQGARPGAAGAMDMVLGRGRDDALVSQQDERVKRFEAEIIRLKAALDTGSVSADQAQQAIAGLERAIQGATDGTVTLGDEFDNILDPSDRITRSFEGLEESAGGAAGGVRDLKDSLEETAISGQDISQQLASQFSQMFQGLINGTMNARQAIGQLLQSLGQLLINEAFSALFSGPSGGGIGGIFSAIFGRRANGGPVQSRRPYLVGERGPEIMVPNTSGTVISNRDLQGGGANDNITVTVDVMPSGEFDARVAGTSQRVAVNVVNANNKRVPGIVANAQKRSG